MFLWNKSFFINLKSFLSLKSEDDDKLDDFLFIPVCLIAVLESELFL